MNAGASGNLTFEGSSLRVLEVTPDRNTGIDKIYVCYDTNGVDMIYGTTAPSNIRIYRYSNLGGAFSEEITDVIRESGRVVIKNAKGDMGYIIEEGDRREYYWLVNYLPHRLTLNAVTASDEPDCDATILQVDGNGDAIHYYTINGQQRTLSRDISVEYDTQEWNEQLKAYANVNAEKIFESLTPQLRITPPAYCSTFFRVSGDRFLEAWNWGQEAESTVEAPMAVAVKTEAIQNDTASVPGDDNASTTEGEEGDTDTPGSNKIKTDEEGLGGSAPADIEFIAYATEGVVHHEWQMSHDPEFQQIDNRFNQQNLDFIFNDEGTFYVRYIGSNSDGSCETISDTYTVKIGASELLCPNVFSPDGDGVNDIWKVSYRSILEFKCWIFDRYGAQMCYFDDPSQGWDGKRGDKVVKPGVYYYVIQALGADGKKYKLSGDINILRHRTPDRDVQTE